MIQVKTREKIKLIDSSLSNSGNCQRDALQTHPGLDLLIGQGATMLQPAKMVGPAALPMSRLLLRYQIAVWRVLEL